MTNVFEIGLSNAASATVLALVVWLVTRVWRHPVLAHTLWFIVLVKLLTPPLLTIPWRLHSTAPTQVTAMSRADDSNAIAADPRGTQQAATTQPRGDETQRSATIAFDGVAEQGNTLNRLNMPLATPNLRGNKHALARLSFVPSWSILVMSTWAVGSVVFLFVTVSRLARFHRALVASAAAPDPVQQMAVDLAARLGIANRFRLRVTEGRLSPLVWPVGRPTILLPRGLLTDMPPTEIRSLLAHEFAHLCRRDHWVRWLELFAATLYWWHPVVWWARRNIQWAEEEACDAWVVAALPDQQTLYATALFNARQLISDSGRRTPLMASALGSGGNLKTRIEHIMNATWKPQLLPRVRLSVLLGALLVLPLSIRVVQATNENTVQNDASASPAASDAADADAANATFVEGQEDVHPDANTSVVAPAKLSPDVGNDAQLEPGEPDPQLQHDLAASVAVDARSTETEMLKIQPGMALLIRVAGTVPDHPIADSYVVEPGGTVALGPEYGRVRVEDLTVAEAEAALVAHLQTILENPRVQVALESRTIARRRVPVPSDPYHIAPGDVLAISVRPALANAPIADDYLVEPNGSVALGPMYGRVKVAGLTLEDAEKALTDHLQKQLKDPRVQITLGGWRVSVNSASRPTQNSPALRPRVNGVNPPADLTANQTVDPAASQAAPARIPPMPAATTRQSENLSGGAGPEELQALQDHVTFLENHFKKADALFRTGSRGGSASAQALAAYELATAQGELALAEGRRTDAIARFEQAQVFAEQALNAVRADNAAATVTDELVLQAARQLSESKRRLIQVRRPASASDIGLKADPTNRNARLREFAPSTSVSSGQESIGVLKLKVERAKKRYDRLLPLYRSSAVSLGEVEDAKSDYEISIERLRQVERVCRYREVKLAAAEADYAMLKELQKKSAGSVTSAVLRKAEFAVELARAELEELAD